ncbi:hypothetical protein COCC4DRAFT_33286 [Bipolaris maydis ATCC 48331]|uniref:Uncharacterized protein n=2 Tax=Cochliobolus heterostrophus TaxID=5016 RepID=M2VDI6_COCH5|nr:uncharacterized protein COCC4DRAFT_33286 [Bipolaris maydis ATCC 48331]EMD97758.1 hypothetical protein COCHEDRAFT_1019081 [Bipolaris maydis C5]ENI02847.1 hypothetical protein COCC4DRAFT_33286 [Bipolaris maydis ATCC 48331]
MVGASIEADGRARSSHDLEPGGGQWRKRWKAVRRADSSGRQAEILVPQTRPSRARLFITTSTTTSSLSLGMEWFFAARPSLQAGYIY